MQPPMGEEGKLDTLLGNLPAKKKQRTHPCVYDEKGYRLKSGTFPLRFPDGVYAEVLLVSSKSKPDRWTVIRGNIDPGEIAAEAAMRETRETSGIVGRLREPERPLGVWTNQDKKTKTSLFMLDMTQELDKWEDEERLRKWFTLDEAEDSLRAGGKPLHLKMFENFKDRLAVLMQEQKEAAERRKAAAPPEEEARGLPEAEEPGPGAGPGGYPAVLHGASGNGLDGRGATLPPLPTHHHMAGPPPLPTHSPLPAHHQLAQLAQHPQHAPQMHQMQHQPHQHQQTHVPPPQHQHQQHQPHQHQQTHAPVPQTSQPQQQQQQQQQAGGPPQHQQHQAHPGHPGLQHLHHPHQLTSHALHHQLHHLPPGVLSGMADLSGHVGSDVGVLDAGDGLGHTAHMQPQQQPQPQPQHQQPHPAQYGGLHQQAHLGVVGAKRKHDDMAKGGVDSAGIEGIPPPPPLQQHGAPAQQP